MKADVSVFRLRKVERKWLNLLSSEEWKTKRTWKREPIEEELELEDLEEEVFILLFPLPRPFFAPLDLEEDVSTVLSYSLHTSRVLQILVLYLPLDFGLSSFLSSQQSRMLNVFFFHSRTFPLNPLFYLLVSHFFAPSSLLPSGVIFFFTFLPLSSLSLL